jgi:chemotaxis response regulator CheB
MPKAAAQIGAAVDILPLPQIAPQVLAALSALPTN